MCYGKATQFSWNGIPTHNTTHVPAVTGQSAEIVGDLAQLAGAATKAYLLAQSVKQAGLVDEAYLKARGQMLTWQQAGNALEAQRDYEAQWNAIAQGIPNKYSGRLGDMYIDKLNHSMELGRLYALSHGGAYQEKETSVWNKNQTDLLGMNVLNAVDSGDMMQVQMERQRLAGQDISPYMQKLDAGIFKRRFNGMIEQKASYKD